MVLLFIKFVVNENRLHAVFLWVGLGFDLTTMSTGNAAEDIRIQELQAQMKNQQDLINKLINQMKGPAAGANNPADNSAFGGVPRPPPPNNTSEPKRGIMEVNISSAW